MNKPVPIFAVALLVLASSLPAQTEDIAATRAASLTARLPDGLYAVVDTPRGVIILELNYGSAPLAVASFVGLAEGSFPEDGKPYFDGITFHRVEPGYVIQGGDPTGTGTGGPGYRFPNEIDPALTFGASGVLGMANAGPDTNGSQFFITLGDSRSLNGGYTIFGRVASGMQAVQAIRKGDPMTTVRIVRKGTQAQGFRMDRASFFAVIQAHSNNLAAEAKRSVDKQIASMRTRFPGLSVGAGGMLFNILSPGNGVKPAPGSTVSVLYTLSDANGTIIDSTSNRGNSPMSFSLGIGQVIPGFEVSVADMAFGEKRVVILPPELAYGSAGAGGVIPPNAVLAFEIELLVK